MLKLTIPVVPSVNSVYRNVKVNLRILTPKGQAYKEQVQYIAKNEARKQKWQFSQGEKLILELWAYWPDARQRDMSNMHKLLPDCLEKILYKNDCMVLVRDMDFEIDRKNPRVELILRKAG